LLRVARSWKRDFEHLERSLLNIELPVHLIWGERDRLVPVSTADTLRQNLQRTTLDVMSGCGHLPYEERPHEFVQLIRQRLTQEHHCGA
jgi:pimeloyl-ACP methyl ester carboxylesterase